MDQSAAPWRVLDEAASPPPQAEAGKQQPAGAGAWLSPRLVVRLGVAGALAVGAFVLAVTGPVGSVQVDGGSVLSSDAPSSSGNPVPAGGRLVVDVQGAVLRPGVQQL